MIRRAPFALGAGVVMLLTACSDAEQEEQAGQTPEVTSQTSEATVASSNSTDPTLPPTAEVAQATGQVEADASTMPAPASQTGTDGAVEPLARQLAAELAEGLARTTTATGNMEIGVGGDSQRMEYAQVLDDGTSLP